MARPSAAKKGIQMSNYKSFMTDLLCHRLSFFLSIVEAVTNMTIIEQCNATSAYLASFPIFLLRSVRKVSRTADVIEPMAGAHKMRDQT